MEEGWYVGRLKEVPGVFSQGQSLAELEENIQDAYELMLDDDDCGSLGPSQTKEVELEV
jgi:predicted RNase H-like HicB family nuclease